MTGLADIGLAALRLREVLLEIEAKQPKLWDEVDGHIEDTAALFADLDILVHRFQLPDVDLSSLEEDGP
jgi:hypothetical protein